MPRTGRALVFLALILWPLAPASGYGGEAHRIVATVAWEQLPEDVRNKIKKILPLESDLAQAATWADEIRALAPGQHGPDQETAAFLRDSRNAFHRQWHFLNLPYGAKEYAPSGWSDDEEMDTVQAINACIDSLSPDRRLPQRFSELTALRLLVHLVGDVHQPLHAATAYVDLNSNQLTNQPEPADRRINTLGGNRLELNPQGNLHAFWDIDAVRLLCKEDDAGKCAAKISQRERASAKSDPTLEQGIAQWAQAWALESNHLAEQAFKMPTIRGHSGRGLSVELSSEYREWAQGITSAQLFKAGSRLAALLVRLLSANRAAPAVGAADFSQPAKIARVVTVSHRLQTVSVPANPTQPAGLPCSQTCAQAGAGQASGSGLCFPSKVYRGGWPEPPEFDSHASSSCQRILGAECKVIDEPAATGLESPWLTLPVDGVPGIKACLRMRITWARLDNGDIGWKLKFRLRQERGTGVEYPPHEKTIAASNGKAEELKDALDHRPKK